ncbi:M16 family metallopeptidase [Herbaspirillum rubrisubalbicans]|uniref:M16 family metallopeptidase n=1 Tax=Herbaspirillum rubrisubalbicans TaxID=80842 RepID=UPI001559D477|nr:pitrilysin family protein [Herbaspirillum rubrisubalbicans]NQE50983.1 zinc protease [Herbaspirillum rubrisubalbicans]
MMGHFRFGLSFQASMKKTFTLLLLALALLLSASAQAALAIQSWTQPDGARVLLVSNHAIPMLDVSVQFDAGRRRDPAAKAGLAELTVASLTRGVHAADGEPALTEAQILDGFADVAAQQQGGAGQDRAGVSLRTLSSPAERDAALGLLARILAQPSFPQAALERDRALSIANLKEELTKPEAIAEKAFMQAAYGHHPYAIEASPATLQAITRDDLLAFHRSHYVANRAVIAMIGDITPEQARTMASALTRALPQGAALPALPPVLAPQGGEQRIAHPASQSHILIGAPALQRGDPDFFALTVGNYVLGGGGFVSRLTDEVREKRGLSYSVYSGFSPLAQPGPFQIGLQTKKEQTAEALRVTRATLDRFLQEGPTSAELKAAKDNLTGGFALRIDSNAKLLENLAVIGFYGLPLDYLDHWIERVRAVSVQDVRAAFRKHVHPQALSTVIVGEGAQ